MDKNEKLQYAIVHITEPFGVGIQWDITEKYQINEKSGTTKFYQLSTPCSIMTKRQIIKRLVILGGERVRRRGRLEIHFNIENFKQAKEWIDSLRLINKLKL